MVSETEVDHGYIDLSLLRRLDRRNIQALDLLLEFKYVSLNDLPLTGEQVRAKSLEEPGGVAGSGEGVNCGGRTGPALRRGLVRAVWIDRFAVVCGGRDRAGAGGLAAAVIPGVDLSLLKGGCIVLPGSRFSRSPRSRSGGWAQRVPETARLASTHADFSKQTEQ